MLTKLTRKILKQPKIERGKPTVAGLTGPEQPLSSHIQDNIQALRSEFEFCTDIVFREFTIELNGPLGVALVYISGLNSLGPSNEFILSEMMLKLPNIVSQAQAGSNDSVQLLVSKLLPTTNITLLDKLKQVLDKILSGDIVMLLDTADKAIGIVVPGMQGRAVEEPDIEPSVRGPRDGFVEGLDTNLALIRRRLKTTQLKTETVVLGKLTQTKIAVCYLKGIAGANIVGEVKARLTRFKGDSIEGSGQVEELLEDATFTLFPTVQNTERPDKTVSALLEGRVAVLTDTTPMALLVPCTFVSLVQAAEDYYHRSVFATSVRLLRFVALNIALLLPAVYVAIVTYHQDILPTPLLISLAAARSGIPFPTFVEVLLMELTFEILREAGLRLPRVSGQAMSTVGGLVIGETAVSAGFVSQGVIIVVALTAIAGFTIPNWEAGFSIRLLRFGLLVSAALLGVPGIMFGLMIVLAHLCDLRSFGVPYLTPIAPLTPGSLKDTFVRVPWWAMILRPRFGGDKKPLRLHVDVAPNNPAEQDGTNEQTADHS